ncbi:hypothetical protein HJG60_009147 [Phyllostomus discolor]|uniref:Uncharacterized protein n=1 Tax=Phyllostomus discolor TaxID=89673 RepID=A0A833YSD1_9CHIR|nr:hypothetical protein HJG60_009147 [Phyllostomus discolor]
MAPSRREGGQGAPHVRSGHSVLIPPQDLVVSVYVFSRASANLPQRSVLTAGRWARVNKEARARRWLCSRTPQGSQTAHRPRHPVVAITYPQNRCSPWTPGVPKGPPPTPRWTQDFRSRPDTWTPAGQTHMRPSVPTVLCEAFLQGPPFCPSACSLRPAWRVFAAPRGDPRPALPSAAQQIDHRTLPRWLPCCPTQRSERRPLPPCETQVYIMKEIHQVQRQRADAARECLQLG